MKRQQRITVYDYTDAIHGSAPWLPQDLMKPVRYDVDAWCVQGEYGIFAFFYTEDKKHFCMASGDDGHWRLLYVCHPHWVHEFKEAMESVCEIQT